MRATVSLPCLHHRRALLPIILLCHVSIMLMYRVASSSARFKLKLKGYHYLPLKYVALLFNPARLYVFQRKLDKENRALKEELLGCSIKKNFRRLLFRFYGRTFSFSDIVRWKTAESKTGKNEWERRRTLLRNSKRTFFTVPFVSRSKELRFDTIIF